MSSLEGTPWKIDIYRTENDDLEICLGNFPFKMVVYDLGT